LAKVLEKQTVGSGGVRYHDGTHDDLDFHVGEILNGKAGTSLVGTLTDRYQIEPSFRKKKQRIMHARKLIRAAIVLSILVVLFWPPKISADNQVMGELKFSAATDAEKDSGVWIDGQYVGYLKELKGNKKVLLLPGFHDIAVRQAGYEDFTRKVLIEPADAQMVAVHMLKDPRAVYPGENAAILKFNITPDRSPVFIDDIYMGPASKFGGFFNSMTLVPGKHRVKIDLPGYRTFETEISVLPEQKLEIKTDLVKGSIEQAGPLIMRR
jgi:PEGA domain-containing protein